MLVAMQHQSSSCTHACMHAGRVQRSCCRQWLAHLVLFQLRLDVLAASWRSSKQRCHRHCHGWYVEGSALRCHSSVGSYVTCAGTAGSTLRFDNLATEVQSMLNRPSTNYGFMVRPVSETGFNTVRR